ncbi:AAA family ATPase [Streptomyces sp. NBC_01476]|uniref:helix-turn-helix transcriptional regulator n=1 Tax=Streptomyces sp. NBC_01476 TaxID=2903881 RepID=UPI002E34B954|nr:AAA family ATPase [Streptomyces sp. NBC_01476]
MVDVPVVVGRAAELKVLRRLVADVAGGRGGVVLVEGEPGIGKSALLAAGLVGAEAAGCQVVSGACDELGQRFPLSVMMRTLGVHEESADPRRAAVAAALSRPAVVPEWSVRMVAGNPVTAAVEQLLGLVDRLTTDGPLVLVVEDLHWADDATLLLWRRLCRTALQAPLLLVGSLRPVPRRAEVDALRGDAQAANAVLLPLGGLPGADVSAMTAELTGGAPGPRLTERLTSAAGNPLYVRELVDALARAEAVRVTRGTAELADDRDTPGTAVSLAAVIADRLDFLPVRVREVLRTAALLGHDFSVTNLASIVGRPVIELVSLLEEAVTAGVLESKGARLRFRHELLRRSLYETTPAALRVALQQQAAQVLMAAGVSVERVATLVLAALDGADGWELDWIAANTADLTYRAPAIVAELLEHALSRIGEDDPRHAGLEDQLATVALALGRWEQAEQISRAILARSSDPARTGQALWVLGRSLQRVGRPDDALEELTSAAGTPRTTALWQARHDALRSSFLISLSRLSEAERVAEQAFDTGEKNADPMAMAYALQIQTVTRVYENGHAGGLPYLDRALAIVGGAPELADLRLQLLGNRFVMLEELDRFAEAAVGARESIAQAERLGTPRLGTLRVQAGALAYVMGRWDDALTEFELAADVPAGVGMGINRLAHLVLIAGHRAEWGAAAQHLDELAHWDTGHDLSGVSTIVLWARSLEAERSGPVHRGVETLAPSLAEAPDERLLNRYYVLPVLTRLALAADDRPTARAAADAARRDAEYKPAPRRQAAAGAARRDAEYKPAPQLQAAADWCRGLLDNDPAALLTAAAYYRDVGRQPQLGNALEDAAVVQAVVGDPADARTTLNEALEVYAALGATWTARRATARLRQLGIRPGVRGTRRRPKTGWPALTDTELRVAELLAQGHSNPDIAAQLILSRRTVETHVSHILTKLRVRSRHDITPPTLPVPEPLDRRALH